MSVKCPFCLGSEISETLPVKEMTKGTREVFDYAVCATCGSPYIMQFPEDIGRYYEGYYSFGDDTLPMEKSAIKLALVDLYARLIVQSGLSSWVRALFRSPSPRQMKFLSPNLQAFLFLGAKGTARILDVGCGRGAFVRMMKRFGYTRASGVDPFLRDADDRDYVERRAIHEVNESYDFILFNHSIEHMPDPEAAIKKCTSILAPGGTLLVQIPNIDSVEFTRYRQHWCWLHAPYHYAIPSRRGIEAMAQRCGFKVVEAICTSRPDHYLYSEEYSRDIPDCDPRSERRALEDGSFDAKRYLSLSKRAHTLNKQLYGDWISYYLKREAGSPQSSLALVSAA
jgi:SAM-dependent methyltransferase